MRIKKIELIGFKSFKDRTVIQFDAGITGIVGPNGCGKSNIVDALLWVMGEMSAKDLRGSTMTDVIFAGSDGYAPAGMAEVSLTLENDGGPFPAQFARFSEIMVTRRLHRNGESEYLINKEAARLRDVQEIFMDTGAGSKGFSIVQQGTIGRIITSKPEDRRMLIEEAAGITKFKARKKESQRKLQSTEQNLVRLQDIIGELKRQIDSLQRQAQRAERYRALKTQLEDLDLYISSHQFRDLKQAADEAQSIFQQAQLQESESEADFQRLQSNLESLKLKLLEQEKQVDEIQSLLFDRQSETQKKELEIQELKFEIEQTRRSEEMKNALSQEQAARRELLSRDLESLQAKFQGLEEQSSSLESLYKEKAEAFQVIQERIEALDEDLTSSRRELFALGQSESSLDAKVQSMQTQLQDLSERENHEKSVLEELHTKLLEFEARKKKVANELEGERQLQLDLVSDAESFEANRKILQNQLTEKRTEVDQFKDQLNQVTSRLYGLENLHSNFEGFDAGVKNIMLWQKTKQAEITADGIVSFQPLSEIVEVQPGYEMAMEAALGPKLQMLLTKQSDTALEALDYLKGQKAGRSSFLSGDISFSAENTDAAPQGEGVEALLKDLVKSSASEQTLGFVLDKVVVVSSIRAALGLRSSYPGWTFVTKEGDVLSPEGVLTGGSEESASTGVLERKREIRELSQAKDEWAGKLALAQAALKKVEEQLETVTSDFEGAQKRKVEQEIKVTALKKDLERAETEYENSKYVLGRQEKELLKLNEQTRSLDSKLSELAAHLQEARQKKANMESKVQALTEDLQSSRMGSDGMQNEVTDLQVRSATSKQELQGVQRQLEMLNTSLQELEQQLSKMSEESQKNSSFLSEGQLQLERAKIDFDALVNRVQELRSQLAEARNTYELQLAEVKQQEEQSFKLQRERSDRQSRMNEAQLKFEQARMKEQYLVEQIRERYMLDLSLIFEERLKTERDFTQAETELKEVRDKVNKIGEVNLSAIEEYEETAKRYEFLTQQQTDLNEAKEQLKKVIDRINRICSKRFKETFDLVNERFTKVFPVLFGGGEARLEIFEDPEKGEMGIEIIAKPPGKKMQNISLMSGGEKALTAVSLIFSIFLVKPSPYCLLDEVDAPLDDANVFRFNDLVREMAKRSQIIVVTHNKNTMEVAGKLYGVTMQEKGVSTMVSVNLASIA